MAAETSQLQNNNNQGTLLTAFGGYFALTNSTVTVTFLCVTVSLSVASMLSFDDGYLLFKLSLFFTEFEAQLAALNV